MCLALHAGGSQLHVTGDECFTLENFCAFVLSDEIRKTLVFCCRLRVLRWFCLGLGWLASTHSWLSIPERCVQLLGNVKQFFSQEKTERPIRPADNTAVGLALLEFVMGYCEWAKVNMEAVRLT